MAKKNYLIPIFVPHKGCPFDCIFCNQNKITGNNECLGEPKVTGDMVTKTIESYLSSIPKDDVHIEVAFFGGSFTGIDKEMQNELLSSAFQYKKNKIIHGIRISTRPDYIDTTILNNLKNYEVTVIELGVQSTDDDVLRLSHRGHSRQHALNAANLIKKNDFILGMQMMIGLPGDTFQKSLNTAVDIINVNPDIVRIYPTLVIKDTYLDKLYKLGEYDPLSFEEAIKQTKSLLILFEKNNIKVIRIGLQPTKNINEGMDVIAGPFHPAFREQVESSIRLDMLIYLIDKINNSTLNIEFQVNPAAVSEVIGLKRINLNIIKKRYPSLKIKLTQNPALKREEIIAKNGIKEIRISKNEWIQGL